METTRTVVCKLAPTPKQAAAIDATLAAFAVACDHAADAARRLGSTNKVKVQHACYREIRETFGLSANLAIRAIARACAALKVPAKMHSKFEPTSIDYDARIFAFQEWNWTFGLTLLSGRVKLATCLGERQKSLLKGQKPTSATLVKRRNGEYFLHVQLTGEAPEPLKPKGTLGVDLGRRRVAVDSDGTIHEATEVNRVRSHYPKVRRSAQAKGTRKSKRLFETAVGEGETPPTGHQPRHQPPHRRYRQADRTGHRARRPRRHPAAHQDPQDGAVSAAELVVLPVAVVHRLQGAGRGCAGDPDRSPVYESNLPCLRRTWSSRWIALSMC